MLEKAKMTRGFAVHAQIWPLLVEYFATANIFQGMKEKTCNRETFSPRTKSNIQYIVIPCFKLSFKEHNWGIIDKNIMLLMAYDSYDHIRFFYRI